MSEFRLEEWEVPPSSDVTKHLVRVEFGLVLWNGEETLVSALAVRLASREMVAFFRPQNADANFVLLSGQSIEHFNLQLGSGKLERVVRHAIKGNGFSFGRLFHIQGETCLLWSAETAWVAPRNLLSNSVFTLPFDWMNEPSARIFNWLWQEWNTPDSQVRFSWEWNRKNNQERHKFLEEHVPRWRELLEVMQDAARIAELPCGATWILDHVDTHNHSPELLARLQPWRELLDTHFLPFEPFPDFAPECLRNYFQFISSHVSVQGEETTHHERLEAYLRLHKWLEQNAPDEIELLAK